MADTFEFLKVNNDFLVLTYGHAIKKCFETISVAFENNQVFFYLFLCCCIGFEKHFCKQNADVEIIYLVFLLDISNSNRVENIFVFLKMRIFHFPAFQEYMICVAII